MKSPQKKSDKLPKGHADPVASDIVEPILEKIENNPKVLRSIIAQSFSGPLPPPNILKSYKEIDPKIVNQILTMANRAQKNAHFKEKLRVVGQFITGVFAPFGAMFIILSALYYGFNLLQNNKNIQGFSSILIAVGTLVGAFYAFVQRNKKTKSSQSPEKPNDEDD